MRLEALSAVDKPGRRSAASGAAELLHEYMALIKARITAMVILTACCGAYLAANSAAGSLLRWQILASILGIGLVASGTAAANEIVERRSDAKMHRTSRRPLVTGAIPLSHAVVVTTLLIAGGTALTGLTSNPLTALLLLGTAVTYVGIYTPLKKVTPLCTAIGAIPGAMPILLGWVAVRGEIGWQGLVLFAILFLWQFPHFHAIALLYAEDYGRGGIRMLAVVEPDGASTRRRIAGYSVAMIAATLVPAFTRMSDPAFGLVALLLGIPVLVQGLRILTARQSVKREAHRMLLATVIYLPLLMIALILDHAI